MWHPMLNTFGIRVIPTDDCFRSSCVCDLAVVVNNKALKGMSVCPLLCFVFAGSMQSRSVSVFARSRSHDRQSRRHDWC